MGTDRVRLGSTAHTAATARVADALVSSKLPETRMRGEPVVTSTLAATSEPWPRVYKPGYAAETAEEEREPR